LGLVREGWGGVLSRLRSGVDPEYGVEWWSEVGVVEWSGSGMVWSGGVGGGVSIPIVRWGGEFILSLRLCSRL
jgi:hypothetical protein